MLSSQHIGKYRTFREIGRGAMGVVYEAVDTENDRPVALKVLRLERLDPAATGELRERFRREAEAGRRLDHPNIVSTYDYGEESATHGAYIAMELIHGRELKSVLDTGIRFDLARIVRVMGEILAAMQHAHERGIVHRDMKPGNVMLLDDGSVKVADFGIAKLGTSELTQMGAVLGTACYMSPEQLSGLPVDGRSDLFACGVILYQLLTHRLPFDGTPIAVMQKVMTERPPAPSTLEGPATKALDAVVAKAMAKKADERYADAATFDRELQAAARAATSRTVAGDGAPAASSPWLRGAVAAVVLSAAAAIAWWALRH